MPDIDSKLRPKPRYEGIISGPFRFEPGLQPLATDFGNGPVDRQLFQIDNTYYDYLRVKRQTRQRRPELCFCEHKFPASAQDALCRLIVNHLEREHSEYFAVYRDKAQVMVHNKLTGARVAFRYRETGLRWTPDPEDKREFRSGFDLLANQLQEDLAIVSRDAERHWLSAIHLCFPNRWCARDKIGRTFAEIHEPVPHFGSIAARQSHLVNAMIDRGPYTRFVWGLSLDGELDHHPQTASHSARFDPEHPRLFLRVERQCVVGLPEFDCALFTIRTYHYELKRECPALAPRVRASIASMDDQTLRYKGIDASRDELLGWLESLVPTARSNHV